MVEKVETRPGRVVSPEEKDRIIARFDRLLQERPGGPLHLVDALTAVRRSPSNYRRVARVAKVVDEVLDSHGIPRDLRGKRSLPREAILEIALKIGEADPTRQEQGIRGAIEMHRSRAVLAPSAVLMGKSSIDGDIPRPLTDFELNVERYIKNHPEGKLFGTQDIARATGRNNAGVLSKGQLDIVARIAGEHGILAGDRGRLPLTEEAFRDACREIGPPQINRQIYGNGRGRAGETKEKVPNADGTQLAGAEVIFRAKPTAVGRDGHQEFEIEAGYSRDGVNGGVGLSVAVVVADFTQSDGFQAIEQEAERGPLTLGDKELIVFVGSLVNAYQKIGEIALGKARIPMTAAHWKLAKDIMQRLNNIVISPEELRLLRRDFPAKLSLSLISQRQALLEQNPKIAKLLELFFVFHNTGIIRERLEVLFSQY